MHWQAAYVLRQWSRLSPTPTATLLRTLDLPEGEVLPDLDLLLGQDALPQAGPQAARLQAWLQHETGDWLSWLLLVRLHDLLALPVQDGQAAWQQAQLLEFMPGESAHLLGGWRLMAGDAQGAVAVMASLVDLRPLRHGSMVRLAQALLRTGNLRAAEVALTRASLSDNPKVLAWLAEVSFHHNYWQEAIATLQKAVRLAPDDLSLWLALAQIQSKSYQISDCRQSLAQVFRLDPDNADARALVLGLYGQLGDSVGYFQALQQKYQQEGSGNSRMLSSVLMTALYQDDLSAQAVAQLHRSLVAKSEASLPPVATLKPRARQQNRPLRVAYVTGDLHRQHPVNIFMLPLLLQQKESDRLQVLVYHTGTMFDQYTARARACAHQWVEAANWDDATLHRKVLADEVDVLIDLAGHTASHRLGVFVMRSAPVQASFLGYPHSTGLQSMDYLMGDAVVSPDTDADLFSEKLARLPGPVFCWSPVDDYPLPQARRAGPVVFGSFNNALKLSPRTIALWAKILKTLPDAVLLLKAPSFMNDEVPTHFRALFMAQGIEAERLVFRGPSELSIMMQEYGDVDIALDPLPYNGGTTSLQALWMGVPLISLQGQSFQNRMGASFLKALGKADWLASDEDEYVAIAARLAQQIDTIRDGRAQLRQQLQQSPLGDIQRYAEDFEALLFRMVEQEAEARL